MATLTMGAQAGHPWSGPSFPHHIQQIMNPSPQPQAQAPHKHAATPNLYHASPFQPRPRNDVDLDRDRLITLLNHFSQLLAAQFNRPLRLVVHGGACMLLHPGVYQLSKEQQHYLPTLPHRKSTRDVDYIHRSFLIEMAQLGVQNAAEKLKHCILATAQHFNLGADWMNSDADIALPMATAPNGMTYDPIYAASVNPNNIELHTIFRSANGMLTLISVTPFWAVALKLVRYSPQDASDICLLLRNGTRLSHTVWSPDMIRTWLFQSCWPMGYSAYDQSRLSTLNSRILHAVQKLDEWNKNETANPTSSLQSASDMAFTSVNVMPTPMTGHVTPLAAMGGGDLLAEEGDREGWRTSWEQGGSRGWNSGKPSRSNSGNHDSPPAQGGFVPPPIHDPYDYSVVRPADDAAARKARKKAKSRSKSASAPSEPPFIPLSYKSPHPPYHSPAYHSPSYNSPAHMSRATSPWLRPPTDKEVTGLLSLRDLDSALGELLPAPYRSMHQVDPALEEARSWRRGLEKKTKKKSSKDKKKKEKEKERKRERERSRTSKWAWDYRYSPTQEANSGGVSDSDGDDSSDDSDSESSDDGKGNSDPRRKSWTGQSNQYGQPNDANPQPPPLYSYNPYQQYGAGPSTGGQAQSYPPPSSSSYPQYAPHTEPVSERKPPPPPLTLSPISRPQDIPHTQHLSTYPGMIVPGQVPGAMNLTMPLQAPSVPHAAPPPSQYSYQGASVAPVRQASGSSSRPSPKDDEGPFIPPMLTGEDMYRYSPHQQQSQLEQQSQLYDSQNRHRQSSLSQSQLLQVQASHRPTSSMANGNPYGRY